VLAAPLLAVSPPLPVYAIAGMESPMLLLALLAGLLAWERALQPGATPRALLAAGGWFALACLTRPDAPLFVAIAAAAMVLPLRGRTRGSPASRVQAAAWLAALPVAALLLQLVFRLVYYGDYVPNTARVKLGVGSGAWHIGWLYLTVAAPVFLPLLLPAVTGAGLAIARGPQRRFAGGLLAMIAAWLVYVVHVGGDFFPAWRFLMPALAPAVLLAGLLAERVAGPQSVRVAAIALAVLVVAAQRWTARWDGVTQGPRSAGQRWPQDYRRIGETLGSGFGAARPLVALHAAGALPYYSRLPCLDMYGLNDAVIAREASRGTAPSALEAAHCRGSPDYLLGRAPDVFFFDLPLPLDTHGLALLDDLRFHDRYRCVWLRCADRSEATPDTGELFAPLWFKVDGRLGLAADGDELLLPAWFLAGYQHPRGMTRERPADPAAGAQWDRDALRVADWNTKWAIARPIDGVVVLEVRRAGALELRSVPLPPGDWRAELEPPAPDCTLELHRDEDGGTTLRMQVPATATPVRARSVRLRRR
jgi:hypothetical protein